MQTACQFVEITKARRDSCDCPFVLKELLDRPESAHHLLFHRKQLAFKTVFADCENALFYFVEETVHLVLFFVGAPNAFGSSRNDFAENIFVSNDFKVVLKIRGCWNKRE